MIKSVYLDTSVFGGYFDEEFSEATVRLFSRIEEEKIGVVISEVLISELENAPERVRNLLDGIPRPQISEIALDSEVEKLAKTYIAENVVGRTSLADCLHIALATVSQADILVSWNFKHIVNVDRMRGYNSVNLKLGYRMINIHSPLELRSDD